MLRGLLLLLTFGLWLASMVLVWQHTRPSDSSVAPGMAATIEEVFAEDAELKKGWKVYADTRGMLRPGEGRRDVAPWNGIDEDELQELGWIVVELKRRGASHVDQLTDMKLRMPKDANIPMLEVLGTITGRIRCTISFDMGLETMSMKMRSDRGFNVDALGMRDGENLRLTQQFFQGDAKVFEHQQNVVLGARAAPGVDITPFHSRSDIGPGRKWSFTTLQARLFSASLDEKPRLETQTVAVTGQTTIQLDRSPVTAYTVESEDKQLRAWYGVTGTVLKQSYRLFDGVDLVLVRTDPLDVKVPRQFRRK